MLKEHTAMIYVILDNISKCQHELTLTLWDHIDILLKPWFQPIFSILIFLKICINIYIIISV